MSSSGITLYEAHRIIFESIVDKLQRWGKRDVRKHMEESFDYGVYKK